MADFSIITERLLVGGQIGDGDWPALVAAGVTHVIDAQSEREDKAPSQDGITVLWIGVPDDGQPKPVEWFAKGLTFGLGALMSPHHIVLTHCAAGVNRGPSQGYAILRALGWSGADALDLLKKKRPVVQARYSGDADTALKALGYTR